MLWDCSLGGRGQNLVLPVSGWYLSRMIGMHWECNRLRTARLCLGPTPETRHPSTFSPAFHMTSGYKTHCGLLFGAPWLQQRVEEAPSPPCRFPRPAGLVHKAPSSSTTLVFCLQGINPLQMICCVCGRSVSAASHRWLTGAQGISFTSQFLLLHKQRLQTQQVTSTTSDHSMDCMGPESSMGHWAPWPRSHWAETRCQQELCSRLVLGVLFQAHWTLGEFRSCRCRAEAFHVFSQLGANLGSERLPAGPCPRTPTVGQLLQARERISPWLRQSLTQHSATLPRV